ncbi:MAG: hypothetical protein WBE89_10625, partial [Methyloceanibacter sp.]
MARKALAFRQVLILRRSNWVRFAEPSRPVTTKDCKAAEAPQNAQRNRSIMVGFGSRLFASTKPGCL